MSKTNAYTRQDEKIPPLIKAFAIALIFAGCFFAYVFNFNPGLSFPGAVITDYSSQLGFSSTAVRVVGSVVALLISVWLNNAKFLAITLVSRAVIEWGDVLVGIVYGGSMVNTIALTVLGALEMWAALVLFKQIRAAHQHAW
jgi:hypothetical protein